MARGWESKSVESQMDDAARRGSRTNLVEPTPEEINLLRELETLKLSRTRVLSDLDLAQNPRYRDILQRSLAYLNEKIAGLEQRQSKPLV
jgi:hypothetical protein